MPERMSRSAKHPIMAEGYCVKCKAKKEIIDAVGEVMKNGRKAIKGKCPTCGTVMFKILGGKAVPPTPAAPAPAKRTSTHCPPLCPQNSPPCSLPVIRVT